MKSQQRSSQRGTLWLVRASRGDSGERAALLCGRGDLYEQITHINRESLKKNWTKSSFFLYTCYPASPATCSHNSSATLCTSVVSAASPRCSLHTRPGHTGHACSTALFSAMLLLLFPDLCLKSHQSSPQPWGQGSCSEHVEKTPQEKYLWGCRGKGQATVQI